MRRDLAGANTGARLAKHLHGNRLRAKLDTLSLGVPVVAAICGDPHPPEAARDGQVACFVVPVTDVHRKSPEVRHPPRAEGSGTWDALARDVRHFQEYNLCNPAKVR